MNETMDPDLARRRLESYARKAAMDGDHRLQASLHGGSESDPTADIDMRRKRLKLWEYKMRADDQAIAELDRARDAYRQPDAMAELRQRNADILAEATRRRVNALRQDGIELPDVSRGVSTVAPPLWPARAPERKPVPKDGWLGT